MLIGSTVIFSGCGSSSSSSGTSASADKSVADDSSNKVTVTYYDTDGKTVLDTAEIEHGGQAEEKTPEKDGYSFTGWFVSPKLSRRYDFSQQVTNDLSLYAGFSKYQKDERSFAIVGNGKSTVLKESNWGKTIGDAEKMKKEDSDTANIYTITVDLCEGDEFQFAADSSWSDQRGAGYMLTMAQDGTTYFKKADGLGKSDSRKSNIQCQKDGNYTFTLTTYPADDTYDTEDSYYTEATKENFNYSPYDTITWTYNGESK